MKIIFGLGNPGKKYIHTRHNVGFAAIEYLLEAYGVERTALSKFTSELYEARFDAGKVLFVKPQTFMNNSGDAVKEILAFYKAKQATDILVIHDEVDLPFGTIRATGSSSHAGQNGIRDIIEKLGSQDFHRIRIGVESRLSRAELPTDSFVLSQFTDEEIKKLSDEIFPKVKTEVDKFLNS